ncbi:MAG: glycine cleavage system protein R [Akkermansiaceae bacterium]
MKTTLVLTILGADRMGLVGSVADCVAAHGGSWQESRMARLAGQFAGILRVECPTPNREGLEEDLHALKNLGLTVMIVHDPSEDADERGILDLEITGLDEPGIVKRITNTLTGMGANVEDWHTSLESAPMAGHLLFCTRGKVRVPDDLTPAQLIESLEVVGAGLTVDVR